MYYEQFTKVVSCSVLLCRLKQTGSPSASKLRKVQRLVAHLFSHKISVRHEYVFLDIILREMRFCGEAACGRVYQSSKAFGNICDAEAGVVDVQ